MIRMRVALYFITNGVGNVATTYVTVTSKFVKVPIMGTSNMGTLEAD